MGLVGIRKLLEEIICNIIIGCVKDKSDGTKNYVDKRYLKSEQDGFKELFNLNTTRKWRKAKTGFRIEKFVEQLLSMLEEF